MEDALQTKNNVDKAVDWTFVAFLPSNCFQIKLLMQKRIKFTDTFL
jgi:hypothetical protein